MDYRSDVACEKRRKKALCSGHRLDEPTGLSLSMVASPQLPLAGRASGGSRAAALEEELPAAAHLRVVGVPDLQPFLPIGAEPALGHDAFEVLGAHQLEQVLAAAEDVIGDHKVPRRAVQRRQQLLAFDPWLRAQITAVQPQQIEGEVGAIRWRASSAWPAERD